jgi:hypothetical protein
MHRRARHITLGNSGASVCWDSRPLTQSDNTTITTWTDRVIALAATRPTNPPVVRTGIQGGQPIIRFSSTSPSLQTAQNNVTRNQGSVMIITVAASTIASGSTYPGVTRTDAGTTQNDRCGLYLRQNKVEAGGRRLDANSYQFVQSGTTSNDVFTVASGWWDFANAQLTAYQNGTATSRSGGFQTSGNSSDTAGIIDIGGDQNLVLPLRGDVGLVLYLQSSSTTLRRRLEHAAAFSFKIPCS